MFSLRTLSVTILPAVAAALSLGVGMSAAQVTTSVAGWTLNGSAKLEKVPDGRLRVLLTPNQQYQAGSAYLSSPVSFHADYRFGFYFQFQMTDPTFAASDGMTFVV